MIKLNDYQFVLKGLKLRDMANDWRGVNKGGYRQVGVGVAKFQVNQGFCFCVRRNSFELSQKDEELKLL
jgi:hypothetical protein